MSREDLLALISQLRTVNAALQARVVEQDARIEAHLTIVFTALAVAREAQNRTGLAIRDLVLQG